MTFDEWWANARDITVRDKETARLAWNAATEEAAKVLENHSTRPGVDASWIGELAGAFVAEQIRKGIK